ncbi:MAG: S8 family serine peptidase, partial [Akkermansiaceae bacterium]
MKIKYLGSAMVVFSLPVFAQQKLTERKKSATTKTRVVLEKNPKGLLLAKFKSGKFTSERILHDLDGDGWCDIWCSLFQKEVEHRSKTIDTDRDGLTDYEEMVLMRNPTVTEKEPRKLTRWGLTMQKREAAAAKIMRMAELKKTWPKRKQKFDLNLAEGFAPDAAEDPDSIRPDNRQWRKKIEARKAKATKEKAQRRATLDAIKRKHGIDAHHDKGTLVGESEVAGPIFMKPQDALSSNSAFVDDLWPSGLYAWQNPAFSRNLTGAGIEVSVFEAFESSGAAGIRLGHTELTGRASQPDGSLPSNHATAVASVIIGGGNLDVFQGGTNQGKLLRGMAYEGNVTGHDLEDFIDETSDSVLAGHRFSNHSYGVPGGWQIRNFGGVNRWFWPLNQFNEDPRLGTYSESMAGGVSSEDLDEFVYSVETQLPVFASGNPNNFGPNQPVVYVVEVNGFPQNSNTPREGFNGDKGFDTVISPSTAKNVLTVGSFTDINFGNNNLHVSDFSGTGPTDDGWLKPEIVSVGQRNQTLGFL